MSEHGLAVVIGVVSIAVLILLALHDLRDWDD